MVQVVLSLTELKVITAPLMGTVSICMVGLPTLAVAVTAVGLTVILLI